MLPLRVNVGRVPTVTVEIGGLVPEQTKLLKLLIVQVKEAEGNRLRVHGLVRAVVVTLPTPEV